MSFRQYGGTVDAGVSVFELLEVSCRIYLVLWWAFSVGWRGFGLLKFWVSIFIFGRWRGWCMFGTYGNVAEQLDAEQSLGTWKK